MTINELARTLDYIYENPSIEKATSVHLFGILYANEIKNAELSVAEIVKASHVPDSYKAELQKGIKLSKYVKVKDEYKF